MHRAGAANPGDLQDTHLCCWDPKPMGKTWGWFPNVPQVILLFQWEENPGF